MSFLRNLNLSATYSPSTTNHSETSSSNQDRHDQTTSEFNRYDQHFLTSNSGNVTTSTNISDTSDRSNFSSTNVHSHSVNSNTNVMNSVIQMPTGGSTAVIYSHPQQPMFAYPTTTAPHVPFYYGPQAAPHYPVQSMSVHPYIAPAIPGPNTSGVQPDILPEQRGINQRRVAIIISNYSKFENARYEDRKGNEQDVKRLKETLSWFGFTFREFHNKKKKTILDALEAFTNEEHRELTSVMVIVLTHGNFGGLLCAMDDEYHTRDVWKPFCECAALKNVPKIFIFQACRGGETEVRCYSTSSATDFQKDEVIPRAVPVLPQNPGFLLAHSSIADHKSVRNEETGTIFIQAFCDQLTTAAEQGTSVDIFSVLTEVNSFVAVAAESNGTSQTSTFTSFLHQPFYLKGTINPNVVQQTAARSHLRFDAANGTRSTRYDKKGTTNVLILYTETFRNQVKTLQDTLENQRYLIEEIRIDENLVSTLSEMCSGSKFEGSGSVTVFVLAEVQNTVSPNQVCEKLYVKTSIHSKIHLHAIWSHFTAARCRCLRNKPKLFFFCDLLERTDHRGEVTTENVYQEPVNNHSDFLWTYCYGKKMFDELTSALFVNPQEDITQMLTTSMRKAGSGNADSKKMSHFESTLRLQFNFHPSQQC